jgi:hypothetical protein
VASEALQQQSADAHSHQLAKEKEAESRLTSVSADLDEARGEIESLKFRGQCYKTFYTRNLRMFVMSCSVCFWQAFPDYSNVLGQGQEASLQLRT